MHIEVNIFYPSVIAQTPDFACGSSLLSNLGHKLHYDDDLYLPMDSDNVLRNMCFNSIFTTIRVLAI